MKSERVLFPFYVILFTPDAFTVRYEIFLLHFFFDTETLFQTNTNDDNTNERYGSVHWKGGSLIFVSCDVTQ